MIDYFAIIHQYIPPNSDTYRIYIPHVSMVTAEALRLAERLGLSTAQRTFIEEAAMLHDIGIVRVNAPALGCTSSLPYICHGVEGRAILEAEGLPAHALVAERHTGVGITRAEIIAHRHPLPPRDMLAVSIEEKIISYADLFYGKKHIWRRKPAAKIRRNLSKFGPHKTDTFNRWLAFFEGD